MCWTEAHKYKEMNPNIRPSYICLKQSVAHGFISSQSSSGYNMRIRYTAPFLAHSNGCGVPQSNRDISFLLPAGVCLSCQYIMASSGCSRPQLLLLPLCLYRSSIHCEPVHSVLIKHFHDVHSMQRLLCRRGCRKEAVYGCEES